MKRRPATSPALGSTLVIGLGNAIRRDDGIGPEVVRRLETRPDLPAGVDLAVDSHGGLRLMERLVGYERAVIVDAMQLGEPPGTVRTLVPGELPTAHSACTHDTNLSTALELGRLSGAQLPDNENITLVGIEVADVNTFGEGCTPQVAAAAPLAEARVLELLTRRG